MDKLFLDILSLIVETFKGKDNPYFKGKSSNRSKSTLIIILLLIVMYFGYNQYAQVREELKSTQNQVRLITFDLDRHKRFESLYNTCSVIQSELEVKLLTAKAACPTPTNRATIEQLLQSE